MCFRKSWMRQFWIEMPVMRYKISIREAVNQDICISLLISLRKSMTWWREPSQTDHGSNVDEFIIQQLISAPYWAGTIRQNCTGTHNVSSQTIHDALREKKAQFLCISLSFRITRIFSTLNMKKLNWWDSAAASFAVKIFQEILYSVDLGVCTSR